MAGGIWAALGAALQQGGNTFGRLTQEENDQKRIAEQQRIQQEQFGAQQQLQQQRHRLDVQQQAGQDKDREFRILNAALEGTAPHAEVSSDVFEKAKNFGMEGQFSVQQAGSMIPGGMIGAVPLMQQRITKNPTIEENAFLEDRKVKKESQDRLAGFQQHLASPEHGKEDFDTQTREAFSHGINNMPMGSKEFDRRQGVEHGHRMSEIGASNLGRTGVKTPGQKWLDNYNVIADNIRLGYGAELAAYAKAAAEGTTEGAQGALTALRTKIQQETDAKAQELLGPPPQHGGADDAGQDADGEEDPTQASIDFIDEDVKRFQGDYQQLKQHAMQNQAQLRAKGIDVRAYIGAIRNKIPKREWSQGEGAGVQPRMPGAFDQKPNPVR